MPTTVHTIDDLRSRRATHRTTTRAEEQCEAFVRTLLHDKLPPQFVFHSLQHTLDVVQIAQYIGMNEGLSNDELELVSIAGWFHDTGYTESYEQHEEHGVAIAEAFLRSLPATDFPADRIAAVSACIMATKMPQSPTNILQQVLCDADLANLGTEDFLDNTERLRDELEWRLGTAFSDEEWYTRSLTFCQTHHYHTACARQLFTEQQAANASWMELIREYQEAERVVDAV
jgi:predicted metal-dependent HD superfamily phosphohydrolase